MRKLKLALGICLVVVFLISCKTTEVNVVKDSTLGQYSYVDIDPLVIGQEWERIITVPVNQCIVETYFSNPDINNPIQFATVFFRLIVMTSILQIIL